MVREEYFDCSGCGMLFLKISEAERGAALLHDCRGSGQEVDDLIVELERELYGWSLYDELMWTEYCQMMEEPENDRA